MGALAKVSPPFLAAGSFRPRKGRRFCELLANRKNQGFKRQGIYSILLGV
ncbi:hypothetical protein HMPREF0262_03680 [Clostridium sp. ATCC 29733]|nr:hypothetical protein HMPREF0262_03680 [Clostridium sp. ATCC 29733]